MHACYPTYVKDGLVIGVGGVGSRLATKAASSLDIDCIIVSADSADRMPGHEFIHIDCDTLVNPSVHAIRGAALPALQELVDAAKCQNIVLVANLAGRSGTALAPMMTRELAGRRLASFVVMPFRYEEDRLFQAGVALARIREYSHTTTVLDNDSMLECNPDLSVKSCYAAGNGALIGVIASMKSATISGDCLVSAGPEKENVDESLRDSIKMLYEMAPPHSIKRSILYMSGSVPVGMIESISRLARGITDAPVAVVAGASDRAGVVLVSSANTMTKFERYDPLSTIPRDHMLDWEEPERSISVDLDLHQLE